MQSGHEEYNYLGFSSKLTEKKDLKCSLEGRIGHVKCLLSCSRTEVEGVVCCRSKLWLESTVRIKKLNVPCPGGHNVDMVFQQHQREKRSESACGLENKKDDVEDGSTQLKCYGECIFAEVMQAQGETYVRRKTLLKEGKEPIKNESVEKKSKDKFKTEGTENKWMRNPEISLVFFECIVLYCLNGFIQLFFF